MLTVENCLAILNAHYATIEPKLPEKFVNLLDIEIILKATYIFEVERRGGKYHESDMSDLAISKLTKWIRNPKRGLIIYGPMGTGKTTVTRALHRLLTTYYRCGDIIISPCEEYHKIFFESEGCGDMICAYRKANLLILDDVGNEPEKCVIWGTPHHPVESLLRSRYDNLKTTIITTNLEDEALLKRYGNGVYERLEETYDRILINGENFRLK